MQQADTVVLIHGIWMTGLEMSLLRLRLARCGYRTRQFHYPSLRRSPADNARRLAAWLERVEGERIHLVAHSLGGIVACHLLATQPPPRLGRVLMLGTPLQGSALARRLNASPWSRWLLGRAGEQGLLGNLPDCGSNSEIGMVAGQRGYGIGRLLYPGLPRPSDGTVSLLETDHPAVGSRLHVHNGHFGMLLSKRVAEAACRFLDCGRFDAS